MRSLSAIFILGCVFVVNATAQSGSLIAQQQPSAVYPESVKSLEINATVFVDARVLPDGSVSSARLQSVRLRLPLDQGFPDSTARELAVRELSDSALSAASLWKFEETDGLPHAVEITFSFHTGRATATFCETRVLPKSKVQRP